MEPQLSETIAISDPAHADALARAPAAPASDRRFAALEGWRGLACLMVFAYHCGLNGFHPPLAFFGSCGVHLFFVLSGYLLFKPFATAMEAGGPLPAVGNYCVRRFIRILPPYLVSLAAFVLLRAAGRVNVPSVWNVVAHGFLVFNYDPRIDFYSINPVYWSLAIEMQFYLLLPIACLAAQRWIGGRSGATACVAFLLALGMAGRFAEVSWLGSWYNSVAKAGGSKVQFRSAIAYLDLFAFGMAAALLMATHGRSIRTLMGRPVGRMAAVLVGAGLVFAANDWQAVRGRGGWQTDGSIAFLTCFPVVMCAGVGLVLLTLLAWPAGGGPWLTSRPLVWVGEVSYSLYLYHIGIQFFVFKLNLFRHKAFAVAAAGNAAVAIGPALAVAAGMYYLVERPSLRRVARVRRQQVAEPLAVAGDPAVPSLQSISLLGP
jgi:peptidoglycan/LPS O-acetylase OafA/YrhL